MHRRPHHYTTVQGPSQHTTVIDNYHGSSGYSLRIGHPPAPRGRSIPLPPLFDRLSPLVDSDQPLPDVPFQMTMHYLLVWGGWRELPCPQYSHRRHTIRCNALLVPATSPPVGELVLMVVNQGDAIYWVRLHPRRSDTNFVTVLDVIETAKEEMLRAEETGVFPNSEQSVRRNSGGTLDWRGVRAVEDQNGISVLCLSL